MLYEEGKGEEKISLIVVIISLFNSTVFNSSRLVEISVVSPVHSTRAREVIHTKGSTLVLLCNGIVLLSAGGREG